MLIKKGSRGGKSIWECDNCNKKFEVENRRATEATNKKQNKFCSSICRLNYQKKVGSKRVTKWVEQNGHPRLKSGCGVTTDGYVWIRVENDNYFHNQVKLHRYLMEVKLGRKLLSTEIVHHKDFNKLNNNIENLEVVTRSEHNKIHNFLTKKRR